MRAKSISREFFASVAAVVLLGLGVMCLAQAALSISYFAQERRAALTGILVQHRHPDAAVCHR